jgi:hypothetical protein
VKPACRRQRSLFDFAASLSAQPAPLSRRINRQRRGLPIHAFRPLPHARDVQNSLRHSINPQIAINLRIRQRHRAKRRKLQPSRDQTKRLAQISRLCQHHAIRPRLAILPLRRREHRGHQHERARSGKPSLPDHVVRHPIARHPAPQQFQPVSHRVVVINPRRNSLHVPRHHVGFNRVQRSTGR